MSPPTSAAPLRLRLAPGRRLRFDAERGRRLGLPDGGHEAGFVFAGMIEQADRAAQPFKHDGAMRIDRVEWEGRAWMVKRLRLGPVERWLYRISPSPPAREWSGARRLERAGCRVAVPVALLRTGREETLLSPWVEAPSLHHYLRGKAPEGATGGPAERERVAAAVGRQLGLISRAGRVNRDHKVSNLLVDADCALRGAQPVLIDVDGLRRRRSAEHAQTMLALLHRTAERAGPTTVRQRLRCLRAAVRTDPSLGSLRQLARRLAESGA